MSVLTDEGRKPETFESRQAAFRTAERLERFCQGELSLGELEGLERNQLEWARGQAAELADGGDLEAARAILLALALLEHRNPAVQVHLAVLTAACGDRETALGFYSRALALKPGCVEAHVGRGELLLEMGRLEDSVQDLIAAVELDPHDTLPAAARARSLLQGVLRAANLRLGTAEPSEDPGSEESP